MRTRFACRFFWLIFTYYAVVYLFLRLLEYFGVPLQSLKAPAMATIIISLLCIILSFLLHGVLCGYSFCRLPN